MWDLQGPRSFMEDETTCGPLCQHPSCWSSNNRKIKGIPHAAPRIPPPEDIETDLPTLKVYDMLGDYGDDNRDLYPTRFGGKPAHSRRHSASMLKEGTTKTTTSSGIKLKAPAGTPRTIDSKEVSNVGPKKQMKVVEVQEVFDFADLNDTWDNTFLPKQCMVWVPNPNYKRKVNKEEMVPINELSHSGKPRILLKNLTGDLLPSDLDYDQMSFTRPMTSWPVGPVIKMESLYNFIPTARRRSPPPSSRRTPYSRGTMGFPSQGGRRPQFIFDMAGLDELLELPRDVLVQVLDNAKPSDFTSRETMHALIERIYPSFTRGFSNLSSQSVELLQQKKLNITENRARNIKTGHLIETKPVFHLDEDGCEQPRHIVDALSERSQQPLDSEYVESIRDLYINRRREYNMKKPLPPIGKGGHKTKLHSISLGLPELPSGVRHTKTFTYNKGNYRNVDLTIAPVPTPPTSFRDSEGPGSDHGTTVRVNIPSVDRMSEKGKELMQEDRGSTDTPHSSRSGRDAAPMHTVSPALSTRVPLAPATTPATQATPGGLSRDNTLRSQGHARHALEQSNSREVTSPTQNIRAPTNSPRLSPEPTGGLDTIREAQHESCNESTLQMSKGERSVRFSQEVPGPGSPSDRGIEGPRSSVTTPIDQPPTPKPTSGNTVRSNKSVQSPVKEKGDVRPKVIKAKEPSLVSTPEPWPSVNEADYDLTPSGTNQGLHESTKNGQSSSEMVDSRLAHQDSSSRNFTTANSTVTLQSEMTTGTSSRNTSAKAESPAPPPPSPESRDRKRDNTSGRRRELASRESSMAQIMEEKDDEPEEGHVRTLVVEVPPLGQPTETPKPKHHRTTDTFINIDIPAGGSEIRDSISAQSHMTEIEERPGTEENESSSQNAADTHTINTRDAVLSVQTSDTDGLTPDPDSQSNMDSAGVTPSMEANESPTSTIPENKLKMDDMKFMDQENEKKDLEMTEEGGDHDGFKQELHDELEKLSRDGTS